MFWLLVTALWATMLLSPFLLLFLFLPSGRDCPRCASETVAIRSRLVHPVRRFASLRWCMGCGWEGVTRNGPSRAPVPKLEVVPEDAGDEDDLPWKSA